MTGSRAEGPTPPDQVLVLAGPGEGEFTEQRSRFLGFARPAADEATARAAVAELAARYHDARHVCRAWRVGALPPPGEFRHDDGEPSGTAGEPLLAALRRAGLTNALVVVVRYFGGIKLGTGGLARAYGTAATLALETAPVTHLALGRRFRATFPYPHRRVVATLVQARGGHPEAESYGVDITWEIWLPHSGSVGFPAALLEATAGVVVAHELDSAT